MEKEREEERVRTDVCIGTNNNRDVYLAARENAEERRRGRKKLLFLQPRPGDC